MKQDNYKEHMNFIKKADRYSKYLVDSVIKSAGSRILDVGCGIGNTAIFFKDKFIVGIDISDFYLKQFKKNLRNAESYKISITDRKANSLKHFNFDTVFCSNVLEHIKDDELALKNMHSLLGEGGNLLLIVPNYNFLYGSLDKEDLHYRRYSKREISVKLKKAGFKVSKQFCINLPGIFWWYLQGKILKTPAKKMSGEGFINKIVPIVKIIDKIAFNRAGLSIVTVARK